MVPRSEIWEWSGSDPWDMEPRGQAKIRETGQKPPLLPDRPISCPSGTTLTITHSGLCLGKGCLQPPDLQKHDQVGQLQPGLSLACLTQPVQIQTLYLSPQSYPSQLFTPLVNGTTICPVAQRTETLPASSPCLVLQIYLVIKSNHV